MVLVLNSWKCSASWVYGVATWRVECSVALRAIAIFANGVGCDVIEAQSVGVVDETGTRIYSVCSADISCGIGAYIPGVGDWRAVACMTPNNHFAGAGREGLEKGGVGNFDWV